jgi:hypothetical protein
MPLIGKDWGESKAGQQGTFGAVADVRPQPRAAELHSRLKKSHGGSRTRGCRW